MFNPTVCFRTRLRIRQYRQKSNSTRGGSKCGERQDSLCSIPTLCVCVCTQELHFSGPKHTAARLIHSALPALGACDTPEYVQQTCMGVSSPIMPPSSSRIFTSAGTMSPRRMIMTSPGTRLMDSIFSTLPLRRALALGASAAAKAYMGKMMCGMRAAACALHLTALERTNSLHVLLFWQQLRSLAPEVAQVV